MFHKKFAAFVFGIFLSFSAMAGPQTDALSTCLADNTSGKDRKELARWIFVAMAAHPELQDLSASLDKARVQTSQAIGTLFTRLLGESCAQQARAAVQSDGSGAFKVAFGLLGQLAMQELMSNAQVNTSISAFERYIDRKKLDAVFGPQ